MGSLSAVGVIFRTRSRLNIRMKSLPLILTILFASLLFVETEVKAEDIDLEDSDDDGIPDDEDDDDDNDGIPDDEDDDDDGDGVLDEDEDDGDSWGTGPKKSSSCLCHTRSPHPSPLSWTSKVHDVWPTPKARKGQQQTREIFGVAAFYSKNCSCTED